MCGFGLNTGSLSLLVLLQQTKFGGFIENLILYSSDAVVSDERDVGVKMAFCCFVLGLGRRAGLLPQALVCVYVWACMYVCMCIAPLERELQAVVSHLVELPGTEPRSSAKAASAVNL